MADLGQEPSEPEHDPGAAAALVDELDALLVASRRQQARLRAALLALVDVVDHD